MIFKSKNELFFWIACFATANVCILFPVLSLEYVTAAIWGIIIGSNAFFCSFVIMLKYLLNRKDLKKYSAAIQELRKLGIVITARQIDKIYSSGFGFDEKGQIVIIDLDGFSMPLSPGHRIILNSKGYPIEVDEYGQTIKAPAQKSFNLTILMSVVGTIVVIGGFVALCMFLPLIGVTLFILFLLTLFFGVLYKTRRETPNSYIQHQKKWIRPQLEKAHEAILQTNGEDIQCFVGDQMHYLHYFIVREGEPYEFIAMQATVLPHKGICLYPSKREVLTVFADKLHNNITLGYEIYFSANESIDYDLIRDIASFCLGVKNNRTDGPTTWNNNRYL